MRTLAIALIALLLVTPATTGHKFNHEARHEDCLVYGAPQSHFVGDGHAHTHDLAAGAALHDHDPCKQVRMDYPEWEDKAPLSEVLPPAVELELLDLLFSDGDATNTEVFVGGEAYQFPVPEGSFRVQDNLVVTSDLQAAGMGFPGSGTYADPYIVEGYLVKGNMVFKDTSKCFVIRNNVVVSRVALAPLVPDPGSIIPLPPLIPEWEQILADALALKDQTLQRLADQDAVKAAWDAQKAAKDAAKSEMDAQRAAWEADWDAFEDDYLATVGETEGLSEEFADWSAVYMSTPEPARAYAQYIASGEVTDREALLPAFEAYQQDLDDDLTGEDVEGWIVGNPPPEDAPPGWWDDEPAWDFERQQHNTFRQHILALVAHYWGELMADAPDQAAYEAFLAEQAQFMAQYQAFVADYQAFLADDLAERADIDRVLGEADADVAEAEAFLAKAAVWTYEYVGQLGRKLYNTARELLEWVLKLLFGILDPDDPNNAAANTGQLILDWNGQCVHAYNNVAADLRVNQNNDRTGFATGGIVEDNRFFTIGQIRHYDGIFRENEVGNRAFLHSLVKPGVTPAPGSVRSVNNDGANQGWYFGNVFYGQIDLDYHGHHHSAGFFAPTSHYHGSTRDVAYMQSGGTCTASYSQVDMAKANGPWVDHPTDNDVEVRGETVLAQGDPALPCLPHFDHAKRWSSVFFNDNVIIDPNGVGLRFEDRDHRADDEQANSENMRELKRPHFHQKWVQMERNAIVGKVFVDVLNAAGTNLWTDDWSAVQSPAGAGRTVEALSHPGAEIVNSHPYRNDAWLDIQGNTFLVTQPTAVLVSDADDLTRFQLKGNRAFALGANAAPGLSPAAFLDWLRASTARTPNAVHSDIVAWGGTDRGLQSFAQLSDLRDGFRVEHCGNVARGLDRGLVATDRIYDDGASIVASCGTSDWGAANPAVLLTYTPAPAPRQRCTEEMRQLVADTDDFYASELAFDTVDGLVAAQTCQSVPIPSAAPRTALPAAPAGGLPA